MKYIKTNHWTNASEQEGLLFFAQILNEALFDYTLDTYKPPALNLRLLCIEALETIDNIKIGLIKKPNLESVIDELLWCLEGDITAKDFLGSKLQGLRERINSRKNELPKLKEAILLLYHYLDDKKYLNKVKELLLDLVPANKEKKKIYSLTRVFITELINYGYNASYIYFKTNKFFFDYKKRFKETSPMTFFEIFDFKEKEFDVVYRVSKLFEEFRNVAENMGFNIVDSYPSTGLFKEAKTFIEGKVENELFVVFKKINALDETTARIKTENTLFKIGNLFSFYHHKETPTISEQALVKSKTDNIVRLLAEPIKSIIKKADVKPTTAAIKVKSLFTTLSLPPNTIYRIGRAIDLHSISLTSEQVENKLLNLWTAIETLIPKDIECGDDRIVQIVKSLTPFQELKYVNKLIEQAGSDFLFFDGTKSKELINSVILKQKENSFFSLAALIMTKENEDNRKKVYEALKTYPLLRFRLFTINQNLSTGIRIKKLLDNHRKKVEWQIRRIYRVRNLIVHSGKVPSYTNILVENLHNYFDDFLNYIIDNAIKDKRIKTISDAILTAEIDCECLRKNINTIHEAETELDNYATVL